MVFSLTVSHFRNYSQASFEFSPTLTLVIGPNTAGKTSMLEALMLLATGKSFRTDRHLESIAFSQEVSHIQAVIGEESVRDRLEMVLTAGLVMGKKTPYKKFSINKVTKRGLDFIGCMPAVLFWPEDLRLITGSPSRRRQYLDGVLSQTSRLYRQSLATYEKALRIRNKLLHLLREGEPIRPEEFEYWTDALLTHGAIIHKERSDYIAFVNKTNSATGTYKTTYEAFKSTAFEMHYDHSTITPERLSHYKHAEQAAGMTLVGPHRDDFYLTKINDNGVELHKFGSRGEQRLGVLFMKIAELDYIKKTLKTTPLLLLDDIFSELDAYHRQLVMQLVSYQQTIMTTTEDMSFDKTDNIGIIHV